MAFHQRIGFFQSIDIINIAEEVRCDAPADFCGNLRKLCPPYHHPLHHPKQPVPA